PRRPILEPVEGEHARSGDQDRQRDHHHVARGGGLGLFDLAVHPFPITRRPRSKWHARRDSNPQPAVLETAALPIELLAYKLCLFRKRQRRLAPPRRFHSVP